MVTGAAGTSTYDFPVVLNSLLGTKFKLVKGYNGSSGLRLAFERGEIEGFCGLGLDSLHSLGIGKDNATILVQTSLKSDPRLAGVPLIADYAKTAETRQIMQLIFGWLVMDRPLAAPPGTPPERVAALRTGFDETMARSSIPRRSRQIELKFLADAWQRDRNFHRCGLSHARGRCPQGGQTAGTARALIASGGSRAAAVRDDELQCLAGRATIGQSRSEARSHNDSMEVRPCCRSTKTSF